jgi:hypothetical protein
MGTHYILIDYENVQPEDLAPLEAHPVRVYVFLGEQQTRLPFDLVSSLQALGDRATYVPINGNGRNALDFHIAYYIGRLSEHDPEGRFHIISRDKGFDPLVAHLRSKDIHARRGNGLAELPFLGAEVASSTEERISEIVRNLHSRGLSRPRKRKTLMSTIHAHFRRELEFAEVQALVDQLIERGYIEMQGEVIHYHHPIKRT